MSIDARATLDSTTFPPLTVVPAPTSGLGLAKAQPAPVVMMVASPGGHIDELKALAQRLGLRDSQLVWVTCKTPQTEGLMHGEEVRWVPSIASNEIGKALLSVPQALHLQDALRPQLVVSTGAALAAPHLLAAAIRATPIWYVESAARVTAPSKTGALAQRLRNTRLLVQGNGWGDARWQPIADVFQDFEVTTGSHRQVRSAVVSLGSERFPFGRAVASANTILGDCDIYWQTGSTPTSDDLRSWAPGDELRSACAASDVVVTHAGVGSVLMSLQSGKVPIVLPRQRSRGEHVDDHQVKMARQLESRGLVVSATPETLSWDHVERAASLTVTRKAV